MIKIYNGDIFDAPIDIIIHQANCFHTMGAGIAKEIKRRYPRAYESDRMTKYGDKYKLGQFSFAAPDEKQDKWIINLYGQHRYGRDKQYTDYTAVALGLANIKHWLIKMNMTDLIIGIPYGMGCNNAGGDWGVVEEIIRAIFGDKEFNILICKK